jgi:hypothetical protein
LRTSPDDLDRVRDRQPRQSRVVCCRGSDAGCGVIRCGRRERLRVACRFTVSDDRSER